MSDMPQSDTYIPLVSPDEKNAILYIDLLFRLILSYNDTIPFNPLLRLREFFSWTETITSSQIRKNIFFYFVEKKVATVPVLVDALGKPRPSIYREIRELLDNDIVEKIVRARYIKKKPGRGPAIYGLKGKWQPDDVVDAINKHKIISSPNFVMVRNISQTILDGYLSRQNVSEIKLNEIIAICKGSCPGFYDFDIADQVANNLSKRGIKVWR